MNKLTLEQQFKLTILRDQIEKLTLKESHKYIYELIRQDMIKDNLFKTLMKGDYDKTILNE